ncbi:MAG TPA: N-acetyltransferase [Porticoccaceae bacterium]|jgi:RimJ/RimL family protein N-acetyltransferase|nr:N-acetyltransferase [Porticoccaceae bacterium]
MSNTTKTKAPLLIPSSRRLSYRLMDENDGDLLWEIDQDPLVMKYINGGYPTSKDDIKQIFLPRLASYRNETKGWGLWQINHIESHDFVGWLLIRPMDFFTDKCNVNNIELGWRLKKRYWGLGYATEAAFAAVKTLWSVTNIQSLWALVDPKNVASVSVIKKLGMQHHKSAIHKDPLGDTYADYFCLQKTPNA